MGRRAIQFDQTYEVIRQRLRSGQDAPGEPLSILDLARQLNQSVTPVREACSRLCGEGLLRRSAASYFCPRLEQQDYCDLLQIHGALLAQALAHLKTEPSTALGRLEPLGHKAQLPNAQADLDKLSFCDLGAVTRSPHGLAARSGEPTWCQQGQEACTLEAVLAQVMRQTHRPILIQTQARLADQLAPLVQWLGWTGPSNLLLAPTAPDQALSPWDRAMLLPPKLQALFNSRAFERLDTEIKSLHEEARKAGPMIFDQIRRRNFI